MLRTAAFVASMAPWLLQAPPADLRQDHCHWVIPQLRSYAPAPGAASVEIAAVHGRVHIEGAVATTVLEIDLKNPSATPLEARLLIPVPDGAVVRGFGMAGSRIGAGAELLPRDVARATYDDIVRRERDPGLLELVGARWVRSSLFPIPAHGTLRAAMEYESLLQIDGARSDYELPRAEALRSSVPWSLDVTIRNDEPLAAIYSPSHAITLEETVPPGSAPASRAARTEARVRVRESSLRQPGSFRLSLLKAKDSLGATLFAYPDASIGGGYFLLIAGAPKAGAPRQREVTLVLDRSGSMAGEKMEQAKRAALQVLEGMQYCERYHLLTYSSSVERFDGAAREKSPGSMREASEFIEKIQAGGGTALDDALSTALQLPASGGMVPLVFFVTDGLPTVGTRSELQIREHAEKLNHAGRRIYTFGVGMDVNVPLLDAIAAGSRGRAAYVLPGEELELAMARVLRTLNGPVLLEPKLRTLDAAGSPVEGVLWDLAPAALPDLFEGEPLVVAGRYRGAGPLRFELSGQVGGSAKSYQFEFPLEKATAKNAFVPRICATRRIAFLTDQIRQAGATGDPLSSGAHRELIEEIVKLSLQWGILTEYTSFLAREGSDLSSLGALAAACRDELKNRAVDQRWGASAVAQGSNYNQRIMQSCANPTNEYVADTLKTVETVTVQQCGDVSLFRRGDRWVDSRLLSRAANPARVLSFGSREHAEVVEKLSREGRQAAAALDGDVLVEVAGETVLMRNPVRVTR